MLINELIPLSKDRLFIWLKTLSNQLSKGSLILDLHDENFSILHANEKFLELANSDTEHLIGQSLTVLNGHRTNNETVKELSLHLKLGIANKFTILHYTQHGSAFWNSIMIHPMRYDEQVIQYVLLTCEDTTEQVLNKMVYKLEHEVYQAINNEDNLQSILNLISEKIESFYIRDVYCTIHLYDESHDIRCLGSNTLPIEVVNKLEILAVAPNIIFNDSTIYLKDFSSNQQNVDLFKMCNLNNIKGSWTKPILTPQNQVIGILTLFNQDEIELKQIDIHYLNRLALLIKLAIKYAEQKIELRRLAFYDVETNLPNVHHFKSELEQWIKDGHKGFIAIISPTEFNKIVNLYGSKAGAELLRQMVERIQLSLPSNEELISRFSNSIILAKKSEANDLQSHQQHIEPLTTMPFLIDGKENYITLKIGYTTFNETMTVDQCIHQTDIAVTQARKYSGTSFAIYEENSTKLLTEEMEIFNQLSYALKNGEFEVYLQPKINFETIKIEGFEALSRWNSHKLGNISPIKYIPIAEQSGKVKEIDLLNFKIILNWLQNRLIDGKKVLPISINISPDHFYDPYFLDNILATFHQFQVPAQYIKLEVTESIELVDFTKAKNILVKLNEFGFESSIDDFGVGFSSLSYLPQLPFSEIKIDRSFVNSMQEPGMYAVVQTIIQLANNIQMRPIAEGIETEEQLTMLQQLGCPAGQGFYFYKPMKLEDAEKLLDVQ